MNEFHFDTILRTSLKQHDINLTDAAVRKLNLHYQLLCRWNRVHNLTTITELNDVVSHHYVDCLLGLNFLRPQKAVTDAGSGAGFPGVVAAVIWPQTQLYLVESSAKKCSFLRLVKAELALENLEVENTRIEDVMPRDFLLSRATFSAQTFSTVAKAIAPGGYLAVWLTETETSKGIVAQAEKLGLQLQKRFDYHLAPELARTIGLFHVKHLA